MTLLKSIAAVFGLIAEILIEYRRKRKRDESQKMADRICVDPGSEWVRKFKRGQTDTASRTDSGKSDD